MKELIKRYEELELKKENGTITMTEESTMCGLYELIFKLINV